MYQKILIKSYQGKGETEIKATVVFDNNTFTYEGDNGVITSIKNGLPHPSNAKEIINETSGKLFLDAILNRYNSPYLYAELEK